MYRESHDLRELAIEYPLKFDDTGGDVGIVGGE